MNFKLKIITGFREDQYSSIDAAEGHKAYYLFTHPEERGVFSNGMALQGKFIQSIQPDWHGTFDYNPNYKLEAEEWNEIRRKGYDKKMSYILEMSKKVSEEIPKNPQITKMKLSEAINHLEFPALDISKKSIEGMQSIENIIKS